MFKSGKSKKSHLKAIVETYFHTFMNRWGINSDYGVSKLIYGGSYHDKGYSEGKNFSSENRVINVIMRAIDGGHFPNDQDGIYLVFGSRFDTISFLVLRFTLAKFLIFKFV